MRAWGAILGAAGFGAIATAIALAALTPAGPGQPVVPELTALPSAKETPERYEDFSLASPAPKGDRLYLPPGPSLSMLEQGLPADLGRGLEPVPAPRSLPETAGPPLPPPAPPRRRISVTPDDLKPPIAPARGKQWAPIPAATLALMAEKHTNAAAPILFRIYKKESELEVWKRNDAGRFVLLKTFPICRWSGQLGPKLKEGDRQTPEGFYSIRPSQMNPHSSYYLAFDVGYPNAFDLAHGGTGSAVMVHGTCSSRGCYAMTDRGVAEIYALARDALAGGQQAIQFQAYPFRMTAENMVKHRTDENIAFWRQLKEGSDRFEALGEELTPYVDKGRYAFKTGSPEKEALVQARRANEQTRITQLTGQGRAAVRTTYSDGGQHPAFLALSRRGFSLGNVSRPEALAFAGQETPVTTGSVSSRARGSSAPR